MELKKDDIERDILEINNLIKLVFNINCKLIIITHIDIPLRENNGAKIEGRSEFVKEIIDICIIHNIKYICPSVALPNICFDNKEIFMDATHYTDYGKSIVNSYIVSELLK